MRATRKHPVVVAIVLGIAFILAVNGIAFMQAWRMTHFVSEGCRTPNPEHLHFAEKLSALFTGVVIPRPANTILPDSLAGSCRTMHFSAKDGTRLEAWYIPVEESTGTVVLFHGYAGAKCSLLEEAAAFRELGFSTLLVDFRGSGGSEGNGTSIGYHEACDVEAALATARTLQPGKPVVLYAKSMGSAAILCAFRRFHITPDALVLETPFDRLLSTAVNRFHTVGLPGFPLAHLLVFWGGIQNGFSGFSHNPVEYAASVKTPCLLMAAGKDDRVLERQSREIYNTLSGTKEFVLFEEAPHISLISVDPKRWENKVSQFLTTHLR